MNGAPAAVLLPLPLPQEMLDHLGITAEQLAKVASLGLSIEDAFARGVVPLPTWLDATSARSYVRDLRQAAAQGLTLADLAKELEEGCTVEEAVKKGTWSEEASAPRS
jgi:hypothetical protein